MLEILIHSINSNRIRINFNKIMKILNRIRIIRISENLISYKTERTNTIIKPMISKIRMNSFQNKFKIKIKLIEDILIN